MRPSRVATALAAAAMAVCGPGCKRAPTGLRVLVTTDFVPSASMPALHSVVLRVRRPGANGAVLREEPITLARDGSNLPLKFSVFLTSAPSDQVVIEAEAHTLESLSRTDPMTMRTGVPVTASRVITGFVEGEIRVVPMVLYRGCWDLGVACTADETCGPQARCESAQRNPSTLPTYNGDAGDPLDVFTPASEASVPMDASADATTVDAGRDATVIEDRFVPPPDNMVMPPVDGGACRTDVGNTITLTVPAMPTVARALLPSIASLDNGMPGAALRYRVAWLTVEGSGLQAVRSATVTSDATTGALSVTSLGIVADPGASQPVTWVQATREGVVYNAGGEVWVDADGEGAGARFRLAFMSNSPTMRATVIGGDIVACQSEGMTLRCARTVRMAGAVQVGPPLPTAMLPATANLVSLDEVPGTLGSPDGGMHAVLISATSVMRCSGALPSLSCSTVVLPEMNTNLVTAALIPDNSMGMMSLQTVFAWGTTTGTVRLGAWPLTGGGGLSESGRSTIMNTVGAGSRIALSISPAQGEALISVGTQRVELHRIRRGNPMGQFDGVSPVPFGVTTGIQVASTTLAPLAQSMGPSGPVDEHALAYPVFRAGDSATPKEIEVRTIRSGCR
jgi:hypothetical protein